MRVGAATRRGGQMATRPERVKDKSVRLHVLATADVDRPTRRADGVAIAHVDQAEGTDEVTALGNPDAHAGGTKLAREPDCR